MVHDPNRMDVANGNQLLELDAINEGQYHKCRYFAIVVELLFNKQQSLVNHQLIKHLFHHHSQAYRVKATVQDECRFGHTELRQDFPYETSRLIMGLPSCPS